MQIILGEENAQSLLEKYTLLELDMIKLSKDTDALTAYCVLDDLSFDNLVMIEQNTNLHSKLIENYRKKNRDYCEQAIEHLKGLWNGEVDSFYNEIEQRVAKYKEQDPGADWDAVIHQY